MTCRRLRVGPGPGLGQRFKMRPAHDYGIKRAAVGRCSQRNTKLNFARAPSHAPGCPDSVPVLLNFDTGLIEMIDQRAKGLTAS